jgi:hypothetical protein
MRFELSGSLIRPSPVVLTLTFSQQVNIAQYISAGHTHFDVICIGAGGGMGGGINSENVGTLIRSTGGAGGGGGFHRVQGLLSALPPTCPVVIGSGGSLGVEDQTNPGLTTDGGDGGYSSFNDTTCLASGGKGGHRVQVNSFTATSLADGGDGGLGGNNVPGGGGKGGVAGTPSATGPGVAGKDGLDGFYNGFIGSGGGGGAGGVSKYGAVTCNAATAGSRGSYSPGDLTVYGPGSPASIDPSTNAANGMPGRAGGAKASPINGLPNVYGSSHGGRNAGDPGVVVVRFYAL